MNLDLLREFSLEAAQRGEEICWRTGNPIEFIASGTDDECAYRSADGNLYIANSSLFRMRPLAWVEDRPVYKGDVLYWKDDGMAHAPYFGTDKITASLTWTKPEPVKKTRTVKFLGYKSHTGSLLLVAETEAVWVHYKRVPSADVTYEVEE